MMFTMRTTLTIEDEVAKALKERAFHSGRSFKAVVNEALRAGLSANEAAPRPRRYRPEVGGGPRRPRDRSRAGAAQVILVDANLLIYAIDSDSPHHRAARRWLEQTLSGATRVGLAWVVILAFLRVTTRGDVVRNPLTAEKALSYVDSWLRQPYVRATSGASPASSTSTRWLESVLELGDDFGSDTDDGADRNLDRCLS